MTTKRTDITHYQIFLVLDEHSKRLDSLDSKVESLISKVGQLSTEVEALGTKVNKIYDLVVDMSGNMKIDMDERTFMGSRVSNHEERLTVVESALLIKPTRDVF